LIWRLKNRNRFHLKKKNFTRLRTSNRVNRDYAAETKNEARKKHTKRSLRVVAGTENQTSEQRVAKASGKIGTKRWQLEWAGAKLRFSA
jgi:hypothetical protein